MVARSLRNLGVALVVAALGASPALATFPGASGKLAWYSTGPGSVGGTSDIFVADPPGPFAPEGGEPVNLTRNPARDECPDWSPDGSRLAFDSNRDGDWEIYVMDADGTDVRQLTFNTVDDYSPSFSPDGTRIAFSSERSGDWEIWTMNADGTGARQLTHSPGYDDEAAWSPDGSRIAFESDRTGDYDVWVANVDGSGETDLTAGDPGQDLWPSWSPSGGIVLYERWAAGDYEIYAMSGDGSGRANLTQSPASLDRTAVFSPDGALVAYSSDGQPPGAPGLLFSARHQVLVRFVTGLASVARQLVPYVGSSLLDDLASLALGPGGGSLGLRPDPPGRLAANGAAADSHPAWQPLAAGDLVVALAGPARARPGKRLTYAISAGSLRTGLVAESVSVTLTLSRRATVLGLPRACSAAGRLVRCDLGSLAPWSGRRLEIRLRAPAGPGSLTLRATIAGSLPDQGPAPSRASLETRLLSPSRASSAAGATAQTR